ncbi:RNA polymerase factor sigma-54 [Erythrobacter sp. LQ02-29]|uniref:RNA polymerase factor sigma-54 n=1 Tax=Erythrobacter sp. LQ02-29 TaxID=2920384 RepID=UPI001F4EA99C|nr:RNA polymerase factor sigma-54 [Erythrobacter sp. LQ02-29]MCP9221550.1 RNA polymerase factor sigma-54 [Erythrobacter sp. LQ02-29]
MALAPRLDLRQSQSLVMTPQLQQAIKLLALSNLEIETFIGEALEANPLLEAGEVRREDGGDEPGEAQAPSEYEADSAGGDEALDIDPGALDHDRDTGDGEWGSALSAPGGAADDLPGIEERHTSGETLAEHLDAQVGAVAGDVREEFLARHIIGLLDEAGYLRSDLAEVARDLGVPLAEAERALEVVQALEPTGVGARNLGECLALQAKEADRYDPCMARLIDNLDLVARGEVSRLKRMCDVDDEDFADMLAELRAYDPRPGLAFGAAEAGAVVPDILLTRDRAGSWKIALNPASLPRVVVNREYVVELREDCRDKASRGWLREKLADARWLVKALDQRQRTILAVAAQIVEQQAGFFAKGVSQLKPLTLRRVAEEIEMHESTVSRVTSNKYLHCERGTFELKYFFTSGVGSADGDGASAESVKARIRALTEAEDPKKILSDDKLVDLLKAEGFDIARRTVAKYREAAGIGSSVERRRAKKLRAAG